MSPETILQLLFTKLDSFATLWMQYITVVAGLLAYLAATPKSARSEFVRFLLACAFAGFAFVNLTGLSRST
jgi:hypothetical protein